ncbi:MAG: hypothetical protein ABSE16_14685 [Verrucomicrobiota bacterium]|jgi:hypothetical protein
MAIVKRESIKAIPTIGRIIIATVPVHGELVQRPAIVIEPDQDQKLWAQIFMKAKGTDLWDGTTHCMLKDLAYDQTGKAENSWRWPDRA